MITARALVRVHLSSWTGQWPTGWRGAAHCGAALLPLRSSYCGALTAEHGICLLRRGRSCKFDFKLNCYPLPARRFARLLMWLARRRRLALQMARQSYIKRTVFFFFGSLWLFRESVFF